MPDNLKLQIQVVVDAKSAPAKLKTIKGGIDDVSAAVKQGARAQQAATRAQDADHPRPSALSALGPEGRPAKQAKTANCNPRVTLHSIRLAPARPPGLLQPGLVAMGRLGGGLPDAGGVVAEVEGIAGMVAVAHGAPSSER